VIAKLTPSVFALIACIGCLRPTEERAERDREVGRAQAEGARIVVSDGLAAVRAMRQGTIRLWSGAPAYRMTLSLSATAARSWELHVQNCLPDAELSVLEGRANIEPIAARIGTERRFSIVTPEAGAVTLTLRLAPPDFEELAPFRFALLSDVQEAIDKLIDIHRRINQEPDVRFLLGAGDLTRQGEVRELERYQRELETLEVPYYTTLGNHELGTDPPPWHDYFGRASFRFVYRGVQFSLLDSGSATIDPLVYGWLDRWLEEGRDRVHIVAMHIPPIDPVGVRNGSFASRNEAKKLLAELAQAHVDLTLYGHLHSFYEFENAGIAARISGGGGAIPERLDGYGRHFLVIDVDASRGVLGTRVVQVDAD
jgi:Icc protein